MANRKDLTIIESTYRIELRTLLKYHDLSHALYNKKTILLETDLVEFTFPILTAHDFEDFDLEKRAAYVFFPEKQCVTEYALTQAEDFEVFRHVETMLCIANQYLYQDLPLLKNSGLDFEFENFVNNSNEVPGRTLLQLAREELKSLMSLLYLRDVESELCRITFDKCLQGTKIDKEFQVTFDNREKKIDAIADKNAKAEFKTIMDAIISHKFEMLKQSANPIILDLIFDTEYFGKKKLELTHESIKALYDKISPNTSNRQSSNENLFRGLLANKLNSYINDELRKKGNAVGVADTSMRLLIYSILLSFGLIDFDMMETYTTNKEKADYIKHLPSKPDKLPQIRPIPKKQN